jgi:hypothetical protein
VRRDTYPQTAERSPNRQILQFAGLTILRRISAPCLVDYLLLNRLLAANENNPNLAGDYPYLFSDFRVARTRDSGASIGAVTPLPSRRRFGEGCKLGLILERVG